MALLVVSFTVPGVSRPLRAQVVQAPDAITPGEFVIDPPTLINLGFEWLVEGDANRTASADRVIGWSGAMWQPFNASPCAEGLQGRRSRFQVEAGFRRGGPGTGTGERH